MPTSNVPISNKDKKDKDDKEPKLIKVKDKDGNILKGEALLLESFHPAVGRIL